MYRLRQVDVKAEHFERQVARVEAERDTFEKKYEDALDKFNASKKELDEVLFLFSPLSTLLLIVYYVRQVVQQMESI